ncbi:phosphoenolpyruvate--protein phosphotransferase [Verrucomicrobiota bacterium]
MDRAVTEKSGKEIVFQGIGVSSGSAVGRAYVKAPHEDHVVERAISADEVPSEIARFESALIKTRHQIRDVQKDCDPAVATIFDAHLLILDDRPFIENVLLGIEKQQKNVESVLNVVSKDFMKALAEVKDEYLRERVADVQDVTRRVLHNLFGKEVSLADIAESDTIVVANDVSPSEVASINKDRVLGIALDLGSPTSHTAILAGKLGIPAVVGLHNISSSVRPGDDILIDGSKGLVVVHPTRARQRRADRAAKTRQRIVTELAHLKDLPAETRDGYRVVLSANIEVPKDSDSVLAFGAEGVGLFRTEYFYMSRQELPSEEEQFEAYHKTAEQLAPAPLIIRTLDLGGDKFLSNMDEVWNEPNPFMGWRAIRFCLAQPDMFRTHLRAILRASVSGNVHIMYPMISTIDEIVRANVILDQAKKELSEEGIAFDPDIEVGAMIEVPSAAVAADLIAPYVKFFSLGTNDLIQYTLGVDRGNERVAYLYEPAHPAILRLMKNTIEVAHRHGIWAGICGSMGGDPLMTPLLLGLGIDELSVTPSLVPVVKDAIRRVTYSEAREIAESALSSESAMDVQDLSRELTKKIAPEILELVE